MVNKRTFTFATKYIKKCKQEFDNSKQIDTIYDILSQRFICYKNYLMNDKYTYDIYVTPNILIDVFPSYTEEKFGLHKKHIAEYYGFRYLCIFPWDDISKICNMISQPLIQIYARQCRLFKLHNNVGKKFINTYSIYKNQMGQLLYLGLVYQGNLVQVMSFRKARSKYDIELSHLCTKARYQVIGGASKLFDFATNGFDLYNIVAYNDLSKFSGDVFEKIGMKLDHINPPQLMWSKDNKYFADSTLWIYHKKKEDMINKSYLPIYNCGSSVYMYV